MMKLQPHYWKSTQRIILPSLVIALMVFYFFRTPVTVIEYDSPEYLEYARKIIEHRSPFISAEEAITSYALSNRTPGYPGLLALFGFRQASVVDAVLPCHAALFIIASTLAIFTFRTHLSPVLTGLGLIIAFSPMWLFARMVLAEWSCACLLLVFATQLCRILSNKDYKRPIAISLFTSLLVLCRPPMLVAIPPLVFLLLMHSKLNTLRTLGILLIGFSPILIWVGFNFQRFHSPILAAALGYSRFAAVSAILPVELDSGDPPELVQFSAEFLKFKLPPGNQLISAAEAYSSPQFEGYFGHNLNEVIRQIPAATGWTYITLNHVLALYANKAIHQNFDSYMIFCWHGLKRLAECSPLGWLALIAPFFWSTNHRFRPVALSACCLAVIHLLHIILVATQGIVIDRYLLLTAQPATFMGWLVAMELLKPPWLKLNISTKLELLR